MRIDQRPFPFTCHAVQKPPARQLVGLLCGAVLVLMILLPGFDDDFQYFPSDRPEGESLQTEHALLLAGALLSLVASKPSGGGYRAMLPSRVVVARRATWITPRAVPFDLIPLGVSSCMFVASGLVIVRVFGGWSQVIEAGPRWIFSGPVIIAIGLGMILYLLSLQLRGIKMTPESITYWRGIGRITLAWDELGDAISTNDVRDHEGDRKHLDKFLPGAKFVVPVERVMDVKLPVHWEDADTPRLLLETDHFAVESSALLTAILALRDDPDLRPLLGTRESKVLFKGPSWWVRRHMYRTQQWWPRGAAPEGIVLEKNGIVKEFQ